MTSSEDADPGLGDDLALEIRSFSLSLAATLETAGGPIESRDGFLVRVYDRAATDGGGGDSESGVPADAAVGYGEATPLAGWTESHDDCEAALERARTAIRNDGPAAALAEVEEQVAARHAVSLALSDLQASRAATPLYRHLGQESMIGRVRANATIGDADPAETARLTREAVERGFDCCKLKVGLRDIEGDVERVRSAREAVGDGVELRVDANEAWTYEEAERALEAFDDLEVSILEQPLPAGALEGHAALRDVSGDVAVALDEGLLEHGVDRICETGAADVVVLKPMALGGVDVAREVAAWVSEFGLTPLVTTTIDGVVARTGAVHLAAAIPDVPACGLATADLLSEDLGRDPVVFEKGAALVPQAKGIGVEGVWPA
ncbi:mandelate racemase/muconate lactonizing enzyme family protein [Halobiforma nitratireducens]|uniref:o-succinylbenzoate synthase n=1 Tax=Halobiforma nitratireducens JCM 10879 TaxID=1227454 RepID=M0LZ40_9EURY|nr:enolase C-terminal domain-like protein [Halobiforma nitratireducens]EMA38716.1 mandelate racemase [Halobiforma nitratireducens JCM 10879]